MAQDFTPEFRKGDALLVVDVQIDFCPGGALPIPSGDRVIPVLNQWIAAADKARVPIYASRDWHPEKHPSFNTEGGEWPPHCIQDTMGARFHPDLRLPRDAVKVTKGTRFDHDQYSAFHDTGLETLLRKQGVKRIWAGGLAQDVCVCHTVLDARKAGFDVGLIPLGSLPVTESGGRDALQKMRDAGVTIEEVSV